MLVNSHAEADESGRIATILPSVEVLRQRGITRLVLGKETFYQYGAPDPQNPEWQSFFEASEVNTYAKELSEAGIDVVVIGFDYRYREKDDEQLKRIDLFPNEGDFLVYQSLLDRMNFTSADKIVKTNYLQRLS